MNLRAIIFDFDGLMLDTKTANTIAYQELYRQNNLEFPMEKWLESIGIASSPFDFTAYLCENSSIKLTPQEVIDIFWKRSIEIINEMPLFPGVEKIILEAKKNGLKLGIASSSPSTWVIRFLKPRKLDVLFDTIVCGDMVEKTKPYPDVYCKALHNLQVKPQEAIALEDSPYGIQAAQAAGIFCVAIPNQLTRNVNLTQADLMLSSLEDLSLKYFKKMEPRSTELRPCLLS